LSTRPALPAHSGRGSVLPECPGESFYRLHRGGRVVHYTGEGDTLYGIPHCLSKKSLLLDHLQRQLTTLWNKSYLCASQISVSINNVALLFGPEDVKKGERFSDASQRLSQWVGRWRGPPWINWLCGSRIPRFPRTPVSGWGTGQQPKRPTYSGGGYGIDFVHLSASFLCAS